MFQTQPCLSLLLLVLKMLDLDDCAALMDAVGTNEGRHIRVREKLRGCHQESCATDVPICSSILCWYTAEICCCTEIKQSGRSLMRKCDDQVAFICEVTWIDV